MEYYAGVTSSFAHVPSTLPSAPPKPLRSQAALVLSPRPAVSVASIAGPCFHEPEIGIFDADRYFNDETHEPPVNRTKFIIAPAERCDDLHRRDDGHAKLARSLSTRSTPTASSETSCNSRSGLLPYSVRVNSLPLKDPASRSPSSAGRRLFRGNCSCSGKKAVDVDEKCPEPKSPLRSALELNSSVISKYPIFRAGEMGLSSIPERAAIDEIVNEFGVEELVRNVKMISLTNCPTNPSLFSASTRLSPSRTFLPEVDRLTVSSSAGFSFPILNDSPSEEPPRESLEVYRPTMETAANAPSDLQRLSVVFPFSDDEARRSFTFPVIPKLSVDDDAASDASSDLFEIESFSTQATYRRRDSLDKVRHGVDLEAAPSIARSECYAPSEVSIQWSVSTAEGFDRASLANFSSAASRCGDLGLVQAEQQRFSGSGRRRCSGLLSCRSKKSVSVSPKPVRPGSVRPTTNRAIWGR
ncbi:hypothetical protein ZIOFF_024259 [Zingiber officinale]|uniref:Protein PHYTOCHROME KINASE SUBSTRATE 4 n=1 Tax=Zingiber officinale TaxID=94328 RepID=A0A8J5GS29_ZINOF|nr:hypothetical protein ZIOFF_024259 [Zingiber officinale]